MEGSQGYIDFYFLQFSIEENRSRRKRTKIYFFKNQYLIIKNLSHK